MAFILDASVVLAVLFEEPIGNLEFGDLLDGQLSSVNYSEFWRGAWIAAWLSILPCDRLRG